MKRDEPEDQDAAWQAIVDNYGEPVLGEEDLAPADPQPAQPVRPAQPARLEWPDADDADAAAADDDDDAAVDPVDRFVPPAPPPLPRPTPDRLIAWLGVFGAPALLLVFVITGFHAPRLIGWLLGAWFVGGFLYLVFRMPGSPRDPWDDGAQV